MKQLHVTETDLKILHMAIMGDSSLAIAARAVLDRPAPEPRVEGQPDYFHPVIRQHGRELFDLVYAAGLAQHGVQLLAGSTRDGEAHKHLRVLAQQFNVISQIATKLGGWSEEEVQACRKDLERAMDAKIIVPRAGGRIVLDS